MYLDTLQIRHSEALIYQQWNGTRHPPKERQLEALASSEKYSGQITKGNIKRMRKAISLLIQKSPVRRIFNTVSNRFHDFSIGFMTLTIADQRNDSASDVYKKCLAPFLKWLRYRGVKDYVWKAELQERGTLHYHIAINEFVHYQFIRDKWNIYQKKAGYLNNFAKQYGHFKPNSTDIHAIQKINNVEAYLTKYLIKEGGGKIDSKIWDCSTNLKKAKYFATELTWRNLEELRKYSTSEKIGEHCTVFRMPAGKAKIVLDSWQMNLYQNHILNI